MRSAFVCFLLTALVASASSRALAAPAFESGDILIRGGRVIDGTGSPARQADVLVRGDRIAAIETISADPPEGVTVLDARGRVVTPGFIDTHAHGDPVKDPEMHNFLAMGVTTICLGQDGSSTRVQEMKQWFDSVDAARPGPNVLTFVGHGTVRRESGIGIFTTPTLEQLHQMASLVEEALQLGAFGLTTGLEYHPGVFATPQELAIVAGPAGRRELVVMSHMRNEDDDQVTSSIRELIAQCRATGARAHASHLKSVYGKGSARAEEILAVLEEGRRSGVTVTADVYPYTASHTGFGILFPDWALPPHDYRQVAVERREELIRYLHQRVARRNGPEAMLFGRGPWAGKTLAQVAAEQQMPYAEVLLELGPQMQRNSPFRGAAYFVMDEELQGRLLVADGVNICSDGSPEMRHPRGYGSFARVLRKFVREDKALPLEKAIHKMSGLPAQTITLDRQGRGTLKPGHYADILIFDPEKVRDTATFAAPHQLAEGFDTILVNGAIIRDGGHFNGIRNGRALRREDR